MSDKDFLELAREAGAAVDVLAMGRHDGTLFSKVDLERFVALAAAAEREACATLVEGATEGRRRIRGCINGEAVKPCEYAAAIRARGTDAS